jgi:hypothetical protein
MCAHPPSGYALCGSGAIDPAAASTACAMLNPSLDLGVGLMSECSAFSLTRAWVSFDSLASTNVDNCVLPPVTLPDGAMVAAMFGRLGWGVDAINTQLYGRFMLTGASAPVLGMLTRASDTYVPQTMTSTSTWQGSAAVDGQIGAPGVAGSSGAGRVYVVAPQVDCNGVPTSPTGARVVLAAPVAWHAP